MSLLDAGARFSACTTLTPCTLAVVDAQRLDEMILSEPNWGWPCWPRCHGAFVA